MTLPEAHLHRSAPVSAAPVIDPASVRPERRDRVPRFGDAVWDLTGLSQNPTVGGNRIRWPSFPDATREQFRHAAWAMANFPLPGDLLRRAPAARASLSLYSITKTVSYWRLFARWMETAGVCSLGQVTADTLEAYRRHLSEERRIAAGTIANRLGGLARLYAYSRAHLPDGAQMAEPPWLTRPVEEFLPAGWGNGENQTPPISAATMEPLLAWALRFVEDFSGDILAAIAERERLEHRASRPSRRDGAAIARGYFQELVDSGRALPSFWSHGRKAVAVTYIAGSLDIATVQVYNLLQTRTWRPIVRGLLRERPGRCPLRIPVRGRLDGAPWADSIGFDDVPALHQHLVTACFITLAYLTGMRPGEVLALEAGCCPDPDPAAPARWAIRGRHFKDARDTEGNHLDCGAPRPAPWITIEPAASAIRVLERLAPAGLLFAAKAHDRRGRSRHSTRALLAGTMAGRIEDFIDWVGAYTADRGREAEAIGPDPGGRIGTRRFRRTLAWHIARRPDGLVALAVQYGHLRTIVSEGYASRSRDGIGDLIDYETARATAEHLADLAEGLGGGAGVSGPAARRLLHAAGRHRDRFGGTVTTKRQYQALLADPLLRVFEHERAYLTCNWDPSKALCRTDRNGKTDAPSLDRCQSGCANIARTDNHAEGLRVEADRLETEAADRLLAGTPHRSDGALTVVSLAAEAGVKRHVLTHRHTDLKDEFYARVRAQGSIPESERNLRERLDQAETRIRALSEANAELTAANEAYARIVNLLTLENAELAQPEAHRMVVPIQSSSRT